MRRILMILELQPADGDQGDQQIQRFEIVQEALL
jgi:hypothetical protein